MLAKIAGVTAQALGSLPDIANALKDLLGDLRERDQAIKLQNETALTLFLRSSYFSTGRWEKPPDGIVPSGVGSVFGAENRTGTAEGTTGCVLFEIVESPDPGEVSQNPSKFSRTGAVLAIYWSEPAAGARKANAIVYKADHLDNGWDPDKSTGYWDDAASRWFDWLSGGKYEYTKSTATRTSEGFTVTYSAGETAEITLTH